MSAPAICSVGLLAVIAAALQACDRRDGFQEDSASTVTVAYSEDAVIGAFDSEPRFLVFLPLLARNEHGDVEGRLARAWEPSPDYREWTYHLRTDVRWHDGTPVTAHDVAFTLKLLRDPEVGELVPRTIESVTVLDDSTITVRGRSNWLYYQTWTVYLPRHLLEAEDPDEFWDWEFWKHPVGNGPYRFVRYLPRTAMEFEANPDHYRAKPKIERVVLKFVDGAMLPELLSGNVDAMPGTSPAQMATLAADRRFEVYYWVSLTESRVIYWQKDHPILGDSRLRKALTLAIDRRGLLRLLDLPEDVPLVDGPFTARQMLRGDLPEPLPYDPDMARSLLGAAGWVDADQDGIRERDGRELRIAAIASSHFSQPGWQELVIYVQDQLRKVGVQMEIEILERGVFSERRRSGDFEALFSWFNAGRLTWQPAAGYVNPRVVELLDAAEVAMDPEVRDHVYRELARLFQDDVPVTFLFPDVWSWAAHRRIRGLSSPWRFDPLESMEHLWLEDEP